MRRKQKEHSTPQIVPAIARECKTCVLRRPRGNRPLFRVGTANPTRRDLQLARLILEGILGRLRRWRSSVRVASTETPHWESTTKNFAIRSVPSSRHVGLVDPTAFTCAPGFSHALLRRFACVGGAPNRLGSGCSRCDAAGAHAYVPETATT